MARAFTWFEKFGDVIKMLPEDAAWKLKLAIVDYGAFGEYPALETPLDALFEALRDDIDNSIEMRERGRCGGRRGKKEETAGQ